MIEIPQKTEVYKDCEGRYHGSYEHALERNKVIYLSNTMDELFTELGFDDDEEETIIKNFVMDYPHKLFKIFQSMNYEVVKKDENN